MNTLGKQRGRAMFTLAFIGLILFMISMISKVFPLYMQHNKVERAMRDLKQQTVLVRRAEKGQIKTLRKAVRDRLNKQFRIDGVTNIPLESIKVERTNKGAVVLLAYDAKSPLLSNISAVVHFNEQVELP